MTSCSSSLGLTLIPKSAATPINSGISIDSNSSFLYIILPRNGGSFLFEFQFVMMVLPDAGCSLFCWDANGRDSRLRLQKYTQNLKPPNIFRIIFVSMVSKKSGKMQGFRYYFCNFARKLKKRWKSRKQNSHCRHLWYRCVRRIQSLNMHLSGGRM